MILSRRLALLPLFALLSGAFPLSLGFDAQAADKAYISVGAARAKKSVIAFPEMRLGPGEPASAARSIRDTFIADLEFMDLFKFLPPAAFIENTKSTPLTLPGFKLSDWSSVGAEFLLKAQVSLEGPNLVVEAHLFDTFGNKEILAKRYVGSARDERTIAHMLANGVVETLTGLPGIFLTKIAMTCNRTGKKEIYVMDFDGTNARQITRHNSLAFAPGWSPDGTKIAYSLYTRHRNNIKNIDLYEYDFSSNTIRMISNRKGINSGAAYSPDGKKIALTMSFLGNPEIFTFDPESNSVTRITSSFGVDVDPAWSPDGKQMAFVSTRAGLSMIYKMNADGSGVQRLTYAGKYNATPSWSPQNNKMAFAGWIDGRFDIFIMNPDGSNIERLTKSQGNNEDPFFSPDGNFIVFSSNRTGQENVYMMNVDGTFVKRLTYGLGSCTTPKWSNPPKTR